MRQPPRCHWCEHPSAYRYATVSEKLTRPERALRDRPRFACVTHLAAAVLDAPRGSVVVFDPDFTHEHQEELEQPAEQTLRMPRLSETVLRRPPAPEVRWLTDRAELLEELARELRHLQDEDALLAVPEPVMACGHTHVNASSGVSWECGLPVGHAGLHEVHGRSWTS